MIQHLENRNMRNTRYIVKCTEYSMMSHMTPMIISRIVSYTLIRPLLTSTTLLQPGRNVQRMNLSPEVRMLHEAACEEKKLTYRDPQTGYSVFTAYAHQKRGKCCGNLCRHCPFHHVAVPEERKKHLGLSKLGDDTK